DAAKRASFQEEFGVPRGAATFEELLADEEVEGLIVTTPNDTHRPLIVQALEAGKPVYVDKPIAHTLADAVAVADAAATTGLPFAVGHSARRLSGSRQMKGWIEDGRLGDLSLVEANFSNERGLELTTDTWRYFADKSPGGTMIQLGVHHADNLQYLVGPPVAVSAHARRLYTDAEVPDAVMAIVEFEGGVLGYIGAGWASPGIYTINLQGTKANLRYDLDFTHWDESQQADQWSSLVSQGYGESVRSPVELGPTDMFREQLEEFALAIRGEAEIEVGAVEGLRALAVVHASIASSERGGAAVEIAELLDQAGAGALA
ncbi:MAG TPA: Gfo/Idh/MocA family oxidoreductase, partial [Solirubrobacterales bacterium]|nr:Gfo/Idh/MocA family oxidoreductase [Solirubrobacterales bacterium]